MMWKISKQTKKCWQKSSVAFCVCVCVFLLFWFLRNELKSIASQPARQLVHNPWEVEKTVGNTTFKLKWKNIVLPAKEREKKTYKHNTIVAVAVLPALQIKISFMFFLIENFLPLDSFRTFCCSVRINIDHANLTRIRSCTENGFYVLR